MSKRSTNRYENRRLAHLRNLDEPARRAYIHWHLPRWRIEAKRRADDLGEPAVWRLVEEQRATALAIDPTGDLLDDLRRICAEAVAAACGRQLVRGSRPPADRARVRHVDRPAPTCV